MWSDSDTTRGNDFKLKAWIFRSDICRKFFTHTVVCTGTGCPEDLWMPREGVDKHPRWCSKADWMGPWAA